eukprot:1682035-Lingulodinium_polyedra.AAC.1
MANRTRFEGHSSEVADVLACMPSPGYIKYGESKKAPVNRHPILAIRALAQQLHGLQSNLCFKKRTLECALQQVAARKPEWVLTKPMQKDFVET